MWGNLPLPIDDLVGRDDDIDQVCELLLAHRLVTIVGTGGIGKTRLALESARRVAGDFSDGAWQCELAEVGTPEAVAPAIGQAIGCRRQPGRTMAESLSEFCWNRQILLVLDNCEHVLGVIVDLVEDILGHGAGVSVLTTSREAFGSRYEHAYPLGPLRSDRTDSAAVELFLRRAAQLDPTVEWDEPQTEAVVAICQRLDGMPLAIELAASRTGGMSPIEIEAHLDGTFRLLRGGRRSVERHRTLQAAIDWSYESLDDNEKQTFQMLSVFSGSWDIKAASSVGRSIGLDEFDVIDRIGELVQKSLVLAEPPRDGVTWYRLLEPLRQYAEDASAAAGQTDLFRAAHLDQYLDWARRWRDELPGRDMRWKMALLDRFANLRAAVRWAIASGDAVRASGVVAQLALAQQQFLLFEIGDWAEQVLMLPEIELLADGAACAAVVAMTYWWRADVPEFIRLANISKSMPGLRRSDFGPASVHALLATVAGDPDQAARQPLTSEQRSSCTIVFLT